MSSTSQLCTNEFDIIVQENWIVNSKDNRLTIFTTMVTSYKLKSDIKDSIEFDQIITQYYECTLISLTTTFV